MTNIALILSFLWNTLPQSLSSRRDLNKALEKVYKNSGLDPFRMTNFSGYL
ncbi:hypothetical protein NZ698_07150 [Chryseobacterium sp. PBS4-4]|uniref:Uncharacterized protein n=1 Tax=Chryseobacterium edaphi TaxID=2976532 RepID=A0ABT2W6D2_9FLAO|nr:hypothetical protein [Chryseobacterium edaphi]